MTSSNGYNSDRLDRIEALVAENSRALAETRLIVAENSRAIAEERQARAEQRQSINQLAQAALSLAQFSREGLQETEQLTRRNAAAIARLDEKMEQYLIEGREHREFIATQVDDIRIETRRIIEHLFGDGNNG
jgi:hypothetical protein